MGHSQSGWLCYREYLGLGLFIIFINDLDEKITGGVMASKFADDTNVRRTVTTEEERAELQEALLKLERWANMWGMEFNVSKCKLSDALRAEQPQAQLHHEGQAVGEDRGGEGPGSGDHGQCETGGPMCKGKSPGLSISEINTSFWAFTSSISGPTWSFQFKNGHHGARRTRSCWKMSKNEQ